MANRGFNPLALVVMIVVALTAGLWSAPVVDFVNGFFPNTPFWRFVEMVLLVTLVSYVSLTAIFEFVFPENKDK